MKVKIGQSIFKNIPGLSYILILVKSANNQRKVSSLTQLLRGTAVVIKNDVKKPAKKTQLDQITDISFKDGSTLLESYNFSSKLKKILAGKDLDSTNNLTNLINFLSLKHFLPVFGFDLDQAEKDFVIDTYQPKKGKKTPDLEFSSQTQNFVIWFPNLLGLPDEELDHLIAEINVQVSKYLQTQISEIYHLDAEHTEIDLGYQSEKEIAYLANPPQTDTQSTEQSTQSESLFEVTFDQPKSIDPADYIKAALQKVMEQEYPDHLSIVPEVSLPKDASHGDLASNLAMKLAKPLSSSPMQIAEQITAHLSKQDLSKVIHKVEIAAPGFINFFLQNQIYTDNLSHIIEVKSAYGKQNLGHNQKIMIEYGSLNVAKPLMAHHFLTTTIGQTLVNLHRALGYNVLAADHPGDWGTQFGKSIYAFKQWGNRQLIEQDPFNELLKLYVKFHDEAEKNPQLEDLARAEFLKLEQGDQENLELWRWMTDISIRDIDITYQTLGVKHDRRYGEAKYNAVLPTLLEHGKQIGVFVPGEKGAFIVDLEDQKLPPALVQRGDGASLYLTRDLASIEDRLKTEADLQKIIYVVGNAQSLHFTQLFASAQKLHQADPNYPICEFKHVATGHMSFADSSMSTRRGNVIKGDDLLKEAYDRATKILQEKLQNQPDKFTEQEMRQLTQGLAISAIKYAFLAQEPSSDWAFDWDKVLSFDGNSAPYLQYTLARSFSIIRKASEQSEQLEVNSKPVSKDQISLFSIEEDQQAASLHAEQLAEQQALAAAEAQLQPFSLPAEQILLKKLSLYPEKIAAAAHQYKPNLLTNYLYELAQDFNTYYSAVPILRSSRPDLLESRLQLVKGTAQILQNGLTVLGLSVFERM
ncbi:arginine--tRNA ligase [Candidatus Peregrinibacteria bacterium]|nr:arginine--tRNA ligase [Candidatus Peregrinibacteria bacterium]